MESVLAVVSLALSVALAVLVYRARQGRYASRTLVTLALLCSVTLALMLASDWPTEILSDFWSSHSVLAGVLGTLLLIGIGFFAFELRESQENERLDASLTAAGFGGLVDHVVDVEVALALASGTARPDELHWPHWQQEQRPLRWLRYRREELLGTSDGKPNRHDPRGSAARVDGTPPCEEWRLQLIDQSVRRLLAGVRDWAPVVSRSRNGVELLVTLAFLRNRLVRLHRDWDAAGEELAMLRHLCRVLAMHLECNSGADGALRPEVLPCLDGTAPQWRGLDELDKVATPAWMRQLQEAAKGMGS